jgi:hypothetical protein
MRQDGEVALDRVHEARHRLAHPFKEQQEKMMTDEQKQIATVEHVIVTDEIVKRFANVYYGGGVPHLMADIRYALFYAMNDEFPASSVLVPNVATETSFVIEWIAAARPPVHPNPMTGKATFGSFDRALKHMRSQAPDAQFVSLTSRTTVTTSADRSDDLRASLTFTD